MQIQLNPVFYQSERLTKEAWNAGSWELIDAKKKKKRKDKQDLFE